MRTCPVCDSSERADLGHYEGGWHLYECACGMRYLDLAGMSQAALDAYYSRGDTSPDLQGEDSIARLTRLAEVAKSYNPLRVMDIGGRYSPLRGMIQGLDTLDAGEPFYGPGLYDLVILSHTLEHVYDVHGLMRSIVEHTCAGGRILIEIPYWPDYNLAGYDAHWQHVNKFTPSHLGLLLVKYGYEARLSKLEDFQEYHCLRAEGVLSASR